MVTIYQLPEFKKELQKLSKKYPTLSEDINDVTSVIVASPNGTGIGKNFTIINSTIDVKIVKVHVHCESLRSRSIRFIYAYHKNKIELVYIEVYFKGDNGNEDRERIREYLNTRNLNKR